FVKLPPHPKREKKGCVVRHADLYSPLRKAKYEWLEDHRIDSTRWIELEPESPNYLFVLQDKARKDEYERGWKMTEVMPVNGVGMVTARNEFVTDFDKQVLIARIRRFRDSEESNERVCEVFNIPVKAGWNIDAARKSLREQRHLEQLVTDVLYRPFDERWIFYHDSVVWRTVRQVMTHFIGHHRENVGMILTRQTRDQWDAFATCVPIIHKALAAYDISSLFPLYLYPDGKLPDHDLFVREEPAEKRRPNFSAAFIKDFYERLGVKFVLDGLGKPSKHIIGPELIFNYAYAVFHSPGYCERYAEFLRTDFPRLPLTNDYTLFKKLAAFGAELVDLHARNRANGS